MNEIQYGLNEGKHFVDSTQRYMTSARIEDSDFAIYKYFATQLEAHGGFLARRIIFEDVLVTKLFRLTLDRINHAKRKIW